MGRMVKPVTFFTGCTHLNMDGVKAYLEYTNQLDFLQSIKVARDQGLSDGEILCSMYAKLCYKSLVLGKNKNITRIRDIPQNIENTFDQGHGSVFEHACCNFITTDCSRVLTH